MTTAVSPIRVAHTIPSRFIFIRMSSVEMGQPPAAKDTLLVDGGQYASLSFFAPSPRSFVEESWHTGNILKKAHSTSRNRVLCSRMKFLPIRPAYRPGRDAGPAAPAEGTEASLQCRLTLRG